MILLPALGGVVMGSGGGGWGGWVHWVMIVGVVPVALVGLYRGLKRHGRLRAGMLGMLGCSILMTSLMWESGDCCGVDGWKYTLVNVAGSLLVAGGHGLNLWDLHRVACDGCPDCEV